VKSRVLAIVLIVVGLLAIAAGLGLRVFTPDDEGHHDGRESTFALNSALGVDELVVEQSGSDATISVAIERAGQSVTEFDEVHDAEMHVFAVRDDLSWFIHADPEMSPDGSSSPVDVISGETLRVVTQSAPKGGPDLLELGTGVVPGGPSAQSDQNITTDDVWTNGDLTIRREAFDFVLSEPWDGDEYHGAPALLTIFRAEDLAFVHDHATVAEPDRFRFNLDLPGRGEYLAALQFNSGAASDGPVTALFRFEL
jgi:hypothetical protein